MHQASVVQRPDTAIHRINLYPVDSAIQCLNNWALGEKRQSGGKFLTWGVLTAAWPPHALGKSYPLMPLFGVCGNQHREQIRSQRVASLSLI